MFKRYLCFDLDGTLIDSSRSGLERILQLAKARNLPVTPEIEQGIRNMWGASPLKLMKTFWPQQEPVSFFDDWEKLDMAKPHSVFPGTREALEKLSPYFNMFIVTNRHFRTIRSQLDHNDIAGFFALIITPDYNGHKKPEPEIMEPIFRKYGADRMGRESIILVGDTVEGDWKLAQATGLEFYAVTAGGVSTKEEFLAAGVAKDHILDSVANLPRILLN
ncbi:MAG: HAD family hydrolase [Candidatus Yanofskybacteria bacterium]|nr:HAD family hydrolase [Candidatus Yanofskybacteria bacterium]